ncbi:hypothetical protein C0585_01450 [Candidatus Woesearchaeota archaeon]|nr:MAG: hypothetical protein C0585_01450 [Candidatus Woesearchaeota archaeon]
MEKLEKLFEFYRVIEKLKDVKRFSTQPQFSETTAEHSWKTIMMTYSTAKELDLDMDILHAVKIAMVHDLPELLVGDTDNLLVYDGKISVIDKETEEESAMKNISKLVSNELGNELFDLWKEYQMNETREAKFVKAMDKLEAISHILYSEEKNARLDHTVQYADKAILNFPELKPFYSIFKRKLKKRFEKQGMEWKEEYELI